MGADEYPDEYHDGYDDEPDAEYDEGYPDVYSDDYEEPDDPAPPSTSRRRWLRIALLIAILIAVIVLVVVLAADVISNEPDPTPAFSPLPMPGAEPDSTGTDDWPPDVPVAVHSLPAMIRHELTGVGEQHGYQFTGSAGQTWIITVALLPGSALDPVVRLYGASGEELASNDDRATDDVSAELRFTLPESGAYRLLVESSQGGITTGGYLLTVWVE